MHIAGGYCTLRILIPTDLRAGSHVSATVRVVAQGGKSIFNGPLDLV